VQFKVRKNLLSIGPFYICESEFPAEINTVVRTTIDTARLEGHNPFGVIVATLA
jgi:hypothetical protein